MASKFTQNRTKKYSDVVSSIKNTQRSKEEPRITKEQVINAFNSFGFNPNERNHNDIGYWTTKPVSEGARLMEELHKRRTEIMQKEDENNKKQEQKTKSDEGIKNKQNESKVALSRLSDEEIISLFDEYGLPAPDQEWVRNHLPNDPQKIRSILDMQRKTANDMLKKDAKNAVNSIPETPKTFATPLTQSSPIPMEGK